MRNFTRVTWSVASSAAVTAMVASGSLFNSASAYDTYRSGSGVGMHADANGECQNSPGRRLTATPTMGTTLGWGRGQNVAWRFYVYNVSTGRFVVQETKWREARVATVRSTTDVYGHTITQTDMYASLPSTSWVVSPGKYRLYVDYAWQTEAGWSYAQSVTTQYSNSYSLLGRWWGYTASTCDIDAVTNR